MVAYSFKPRFVDPIKLGLGLAVPATIPPTRPKRHTIREERVRNHAHVGDILQLYCYQRSPSGFKIGEARCTGSAPIVLDFKNKCVSIRLKTGGAATFANRKERDRFARSDGFEDWADLVAFWQVEHPKLGDTFEGVIVYWEPIHE